MTSQIDKSQQIFIEHYPQFMKVMRKLGAQDWYLDGGYAMFIGPYHAGIYAQIYKPNWHNYTLEGVHFETGLTPESLAEKKLQLDLHVGHRNLFDRQKFNQITIPQMAEVVEGWDSGNMFPEIKFSRTNLSERLSIWIKVTKSGFADQVAAGFAQLAELSPIIDRGLAEL
jgi:hypothetical protein